ncbi:hypothetical protein L6452_16335 [Arctium lappa]|uniref:Uncharacterized protein n=1 Tax=Arctium lappa TaxID=4217 RepID=A0ACB9C0C8_ARCLA|nr:hypothetical protein L6452_16335 [Arctium lappa]
MKNRPKLHWTCSPHVPAIFMRTKSTFTRAHRLQCFGVSMAMGLSGGLAEDLRRRRLTIIVAFLWPVSDSVACSSGVKMMPMISKCIITGTQRDTKRVRAKSDPEHIGIGLLVEGSLLIRILLFLCWSGDHVGPRLKGKKTGNNSVQSSYTSAKYYG